VQNEKNNLKILGIIDENPFGYGTWSGSSKYFFSALKENNYLLDAISAKPGKLISNFYKLVSIQPNIRAWKLKYHLNTNYYNQMTKVALKKIEHFRTNDYDAILQIGAWYSLAEKTNKMTVSYHDGNLYAMVNNPGRGLNYNYRFVRKCMAYERNLYKKLDIIFTMSEWLAGMFHKGFGVNKQKIKTVGAGINLPYIKKIENKSYSSPNVLFVGKMFERKGGTYLLDAFSKVRKEIPNAKLTIIGPHLENTPEGVESLGFIPKNNDAGIEKLLNEYSKASLFVMPSLYEPFGIVFAEAMAHKLPCIGTDTCAMPEIIKNGETGYIVPLHDSETLSKRILDILKEPKLAKEFGENGYTHYKKNYKWDIVSKKIIESIKSYSS
jgi:glycosyltransferase involved in cell wall biosynthesis